MLQSLQNKLELNCSLLVAISIADPPLNKQAAYLKIYNSDYQFA